VIVTHDQRIAAQAQRVVYLRDGRLAQEAAPGRGGRPLTSLLDTSA
jgi:ABC-type sulfate/molybdate transport systems ATPase subunit